MIQTTTNRSRTVFQRAHTGSEVLLGSAHEFTRDTGEHIEGCLACEEIAYYELTSSERRPDGQVSRRVSPVPPVLWTLHGLAVDTLRWI